MKLRYVASVLAALLVLASSAVARAQDAPPLVPVQPAPVREAERLDMLLPFSAGSLVLGGLLTLGGAITFATSSPIRHCGVTDCVEQPNRLDANIGASLVGAGLGFTVVGGFGMIGWAANAPRGTERRANDVMMSVGLSTVSLAGASLGLGIGQALTWDDVDHRLNTAWPFFLSSGVLAAVGIPLLAVGADIVTDADREADRQRELALRSDDAPKEMHSPGMVIAGGILTGIGGIAGISGTAIVLLDLTSNGEWQGLLSLVVGAPLLGGGGLFCSIGIPLIAVGAKREPQRAANDFVPVVDIGPAGLTASWSLQ